jgi:membrane protease YdiL (CAAX protease family)
LKALGQILFYLVATVLIGALLAPALYWSAHLAANHLHSATIDDFLGRTDFTRFFHRAMTVSALALLWPLLRMLRIENFAFDLGLVHDRRGWKRLLAGFLIATIPTLVLAGILLMTGAYRIHSHIDLTKAVLFPLIAAVATSLLEEFLFRGALQGAVRRTAVDSFAVISVAVLFAVVHFLTPQTAEPAQIHWWSGLALLPDTFSQFRQPGLLLLGFTSLLIVGLILGYARLKTRSLWMPIGLHAGWVLCKMSLMEIVRHPKAWPWIGPDIVTGIGPLVTLLATGGAVWWLLKDTRS